MNNQPNDWTWCERLTEGWMTAGQHAACSSWGTDWAHVSRLNPLSSSHKEKCWSTLSSVRTGWKAGADVQVRFRLPCQTDVQLMHWNLRLHNPKYKESEIQMLNLTNQNRTNQTLNHFKPGLLHICKVHMLHKDQTRAGLSLKQENNNCNIKLCKHRV